MEPEKVSQASVVPFRFGDSGIEFCLITTRKSQRWGFPKGGIRNHATVAEAALAEANEEAGLTGWIAGEPLGQYSYKKKGRQCAVTVLLMVVDDCSADWKESAERRRKWVSAKEAHQLLDRPNLNEFLERAGQRLKAVVNLGGDGFAGQIGVMAPNG
jgi:8-oxo-dGTP pyrophosphatase MutT (NUDIX family)